MECFLLVPGVTMWTSLSVRDCAGYAVGPCGIVLPENARAEFTEEITQAEFAGLKCTMLR